MIRTIFKRLFVSFLLLAMVYGILQIENVQKALIKTVVNIFTPYKIESIQINKNSKFPFDISIPEVALSNKNNETITLSGVTCRLANFSLNGIHLCVIKAKIETSNEPLNWDSPGKIADALQKFTNYLQHFKYIDICQLEIQQKTLSLHKRANSSVVVKILPTEAPLTIVSSNDKLENESSLRDPQKRENPELTLTFTPLSDHTQLQIDGTWLDQPITCNAQIRENSIDFTANGNIAINKQLDKFLGNNISITGQLIKDTEWQLKPLKVITSTGHILQCECLYEDNKLKILAQLDDGSTNNVKLDVTVSLNPFEINGQADVVIDDVQKFLKSPGAKGKIKLQAKLLNVSSFEKGSINLHGNGIIDDCEFHLPIQVDIDLKDGLGQGKLNLNKGHYQNNALEALIDFNSTATSVNIDKLKLKLHDFQLTLLKPTTYNFKSGLMPTSLQFCGGTVDIKNLTFVDLETYTCLINLHNIQLSNLMIGQEASGSLNGCLQKLQQTPLTFKMNLTNGSWQQHKQKILNNLIAHLDGNLDNSTLKWKLDISDQDKVNLQSTGSFDNSTIDACLKGKLSLKLLTDWLGSGDRIFGDIAINLKAKGPMQNLIWEGTVNADNGLYEHNEVGTFYQNITIRTYAKGKRLFITQFDGRDTTNSNDPNHGQLHGEGWIDFSEITAPVFHVPLRLNHLRISQNDSFTSNASGNLLINGKGDAVNCKGEVTLENAEYFISENSEKMIPSIVDQKIIHKKIHKKNTGSAFPLDILVHVPVGSFKVTGTGVNSVWSGDIYVKKSIVNPFLVGSVELHEGTLNVLGKVLKITQGKVTFVDDDRNNPRLDIKAIRDVGDGVIVAIEIKGSGSNTIIDFTSTPPMAKEEILAILLFGKKLGEVSVLQSIQLAELTKSNDSSIFEKVRDSFGFDQFEFKTSTRGGAAEHDTDATPAERAAGKTTQAVRIGKEFGKVQVGIEQGAGSETSKVIVSTPLGNNLVLQGDVGGDSGGGISWVKRY